jgi:hypothetical protein
MPQSLAIKQPPKDELEKKRRSSEFINKKRSPGQIQNIMELVTKALKISSLDITKSNGNIGKNVGQYFGKVDGRYVAYVKDETDSHIAIHELIHHVQALKTSDQDVHGGSWKKAVRMVIKVLNTKLDLNITVKNIPVYRHHAGSPIENI